MNETTNNRNNETTNVNTADLCIKLESIEFKGITLKGLTMSAHADFSDEKVRVETEGAITVLKALFAFADSKLDRVIEHAIEADNKRLELRQKEVEHEAERRKARIETENAQRDFWKARTEAIVAALKRGDAEAAEAEALKGSEE